jgi:hypothetical protein
MTPVAILHPRPGAAQEDSPRSGRVPAGLADVPLACPCRADGPRPAATQHNFGGLPRKRAQCAAMATNYVLVDFENLKPDLSALVGEPFQIKLFIGAKQQSERHHFRVFDSILDLGAQVERIKVPQSGKNAVDMNIAYHIGKLSIDGRASFFIFSRDTKDFAPLIKFLNDKGVTCQLVTTAEEILASRQKAVAHAQAQAARKNPIPKPAAKRLQDQRLDRIIKQLHSMSGKPATRAKLTQTITSYFKQHGGELDDKAIEHIIQQLIDMRVISLQGGKVSYHLDGGH